MGTFTPELTFGEYSYGTMAEDPGISYKTLIYGSFSPLSPLSLFAASEPGFWYDPSDLSTLFQDTAGTTPVTAAGQSVGRILDKSGRGNHATQSTSLSRPTYQVDGNGRGYLNFDGSDDSLVTGTITPGTDKAQVFAGLRKASNAAAGILIMHSDNWSGVSGTFIMIAPASTGGDYVAGSRGTAADGPTIKSTTATFAAPDTAVITGLFDIAGDSAVARRNGVAATPATGDQGTGNFSAQTVRIGRYGTSSLPFNGRIYGLICRFGPNLTADQIAQTEAWVNSKTGAY